MRSRQPVSRSVGLLLAGTAILVASIGSSSAQEGDEPPADAATVYKGRPYSPYADRELPDDGSFR